VSSIIVKAASKRHRAEVESRSRRLLVSYAICESATIMMAPYRKKDLGGVKERDRVRYRVSADRMLGGECRVREQSRRANLEGRIKRGRVERQSRRLSVMHYCVGLPLSYGRFY
jgi:hypothetical protein